HGTTLARWILPTTLLFSLAVAAVPAHAQGVFFGQMTPLTPRAESGLSLAGIYLGAATDDIGATGQLRFGIGQPNCDIGIEGGFASLGPSGYKSTAVGGSVDLKAALWHPTTNHNIHLGGDARLFFS